MNTEQLHQLLAVFGLQDPFSGVKPPHCVSVLMDGDELEFIVIWEIPDGDYAQAEYKDGEWKWTVVNVFKDEPITQEKGLSLIR